MKKTLILLVLLFSSSVFAEDISDFEIEGMSVEDSLLDYFSEEEINNSFNYDEYPSDMKFRITEINSKNKSSLYIAYQFYHKPEDRSFKIHGIKGMIDCKDKKECEKVYEDIKLDLSTIFKNEKKREYTFKHPDDKSGKSTVTRTTFIFNLGGIISVLYFDWSDSMEFSNNVAVEIDTEEVRTWILSDWGTK